ncbi:MAG: HlyD family efflux transporter periplasmic adaptor subunit [Clostridiales bacterium]|nr:HlyD family efflux transporter periplasmic adaptor subunit [Clostridiales bacterium]
MKKYLVWLLVILFTPLAAWAEGSGPASVSPAVTANGMVKAVQTYDVTAPFSGTLLPFDWSRGDTVQAEEVLFKLDTQKIYAPESGTLSLFAREGDLAEDVIGQYGSLGSIQKTQPYLINCTTRGAYQAVDTKFVSVGETLYFRFTDDSKVKGEGRVIAASPAGYTVQITSGAFEMGEQVKLYRDERRNSRSCVGQGVVSRALEQPVLGSGRVIACLVSDGQKVQKGDLLFETVAADAAPGTATSITAPQGGVMDMPKVMAGQQVYRGQVLVTLQDTSAFKVVAQVDEVDLPRVRVGGSVEILFDSYPGQPVPGTVTAISGLGEFRQNATYYDVDIAFSTGMDIRLMMNATVTFP